MTIDACTAVVTRPMVEGADGQLAIVPPPRPPSCSQIWLRTKPTRGREKTRRSVRVGSAARGATIGERLNRHYGAQ